MRILLPQGINNPLKRWHKDGGKHPTDPNLRVTVCGMRYVYGGPVQPQALRHFECAKCYLPFWKGR